MDKTKYISIFIVGLIFVVFSYINLSRTAYYDVLQVISPFEFIVDKNSNGLIDDNELVRFESDYKYFTKEDLSLAKKLSITDDYAYAFAYLTEKYINDVLLDKKINLNTEKSIDNIIINGDKYLNLLSKSGYFFKDDKPLNQNAYNKRLLQIKKNNYHVYNVKSGKYHRLSCEYGHKSHNYLILAKYQLPKGAKPCQFCIPSNEKIALNISNRKLVCNSGALKLFLTDYTINLRPNRYGKTEICKEIVKQINEAKETIDIAIYGYDRVPVIEQAIKRAIKRGVTIRLVYDSDEKGQNIYNNTFQFADLIKNSVNDRNYLHSKNNGNYNAIMHNKFYIFDNSTVITGSANLSHTDMSDFNANCAILIGSKQVAEIYTREFEQMYNNKFHTLKQKIMNKENIKIGNSVISIYFSPQDNIIHKVLIPAINNAKKYIYMPVFIITDKDLATSLVKAKNRGVKIRLIVDATNARNKYSQHHYLRKNGIEVKTENYAGKLHSKSVIIDDNFTIIGSMNFSKSGENRNDENVIVIKDKNLTLFYKDYFTYLWGKIKDYCLNHDVASEGILSIGSCSDGIDNDYDGKTDILDEGCRMKK